MISPEQSGDIKKNYCGHKIELFLDNLGNQELDNLRDHKHDGFHPGLFTIIDSLKNILKSREICLSNLKSVVFLDNLDNLRNGIVEHNNSCYNIK